MKLPTDIPAEETFLLPLAAKQVARVRFSPLAPLKNEILTEADIAATADNLGRQLAASGHNEGRGAAVIIGGGEPLATPELTLSALRTLRSRFPQLALGLRTLGLGVGQYAAELAQARLDFAEVEVAGVDAEVLGGVYAWVRPGRHTVKLSTAIEQLVREQREGVAAFTFQGIGVRIRTTLYPDINTGDVGAIASAMKEMGAEVIALEPWQAVEEAEVPLRSCIEAEMKRAVEAAELSLTVERQKEIAACFKTEVEAKLPKPTRERPNVAVASTDGIDIDLHLGIAEKLLIYGPREDGLACLLEVRAAPAAGTEQRWNVLADLLPDCFAILASSAGAAPRRALGELGIKVVAGEENIEGVVDLLYGGGKKGGKGGK